MNDALRRVIEHDAYRRALLDVLSRFGETKGEIDRGDLVWALEEMLFRDLADEADLVAHFRGGVTRS